MRHCEAGKPTWRRRSEQLSGSAASTPDTSRRGLQAVIRLDGFRRLWLGQIFSQLADKFYIVLMVFLIPSTG